MELKVISMMTSAECFAAGSAEFSSCPEVTFKHWLRCSVVVDLLTGVYHWGVDNYGDGSTPVLGEQIAAFQGHHKEPWTITEREFCNNVHKVGLLALCDAL